MQNNKSQKTNSFFDRTKHFWVILLALLVFNYGWQVTEINLGEMVRDFHLIKPLLFALVQPDLITYNTESVSFDTAFFIGKPPIRPFSQNENISSSIRISRFWGEIGDPIVVEGTSLKPNIRGQLLWINSIEQEFLLGTISTNAQGEFRLETQVPALARGNKQLIRVTLTWATKGWHISHTLRLAAEKMVETIFLALMATTFALIVAIPLSFLGARNLMAGRPTGRIIYYSVRTIFNVLRSIEPLVLAILFAVWVGIGPFAGVLALGFHSIASLGKLFSEQIESIEQGPIDAVTSTGATQIQVVFYAVLPQIIPQFLAFTFYRWDINVRMSTIIGFVGGGGIGFLLQQWINLLKYNEAGTALLLILIAVTTLDGLSAKVREKIR